MHNELASCPSDRSTSSRFANHPQSPQEHPWRYGAGLSAPVTYRNLLSSPFGDLGLDIENDLDLLSYMPWGDSKPDYGLNLSDRAFDLEWSEFGLRPP